MSRPAETYRAGRRNRWRSCVGLVDDPGKLWAAYRLDSNWRRAFDDSVAKVRPHMARGWDYSKGDREKFNSVRETYLAAKKQYRRLHWWT